MPSRRLTALTQDGGEQPLLQYSPMCSVWALTSYDACDIRCSYCASYAQGPSEPIVPAASVRDVLERELVHVPQHQLISVGPIIDGYTHAEATCGVTRAALEVLVEQGRPLVIVTKGPTVLRDVDLLAGHPDARVCVSLPSFDEAVLARIEPQAPTAAERTALVEALHDAGVTVQLHVQPWIPDMADALEMVEWAAGRFDTWFAPLNVQNPVVAASGWGARLTQRAINEAYVAEMKRVGPRPRVVWARPVWLGEELLAASAWDQPMPDCHLSADGAAAVASPRRRSVDASRTAREVATATRILTAFGSDRFALIGMEVLSAHLRCYAGRYPERRLSSEGPDPAVRVWDLADALSGGSCTVDEIGADGPVVRARHTVEGVASRPIEGAEAGDHLAATLTTVFRFDEHGLVIEMWQDIDSVRITAPVSA